ncbi:acetylxylan esterase [Chryseolinea sp. T2]|uniref:glucuronyl esterase domain-containing protein n=1 Tax=Chryseolinea sp. T2 TaxID=3129255 RepID=UPI003078909F
MITRINFSAGTGRRWPAFILVPIALSLMTLSASAQFSQATRDSINKITQADYAQMLGQLGLTADGMRRGPSGDPSAPNAANRFEDKVNAYSLPDPLQAKSGKKVKSAPEWWNVRRPEIVADFDHEVYGKLPANIPGVTWETVYVRDTVVGNMPIHEKLLKGVVDNSSYPSVKVEIELLVATPSKSTQPVPVVIEFGWIKNPFNRGPVQPLGLGSAGEPTWKEQLIMRGWGYAILVPSSIQADNGAGLTQGIIGLVNKGQYRKPADWGALRAWAWGASRVIDYLETDKNVDSKRLAIEGLSRYGKATAVAMAFEPRFSLAFIGSSGAGGAKILRRIFGEQIENLCSSGEYQWFAGNFIRYASKLTAQDVPVDAHELIALCAPRPVFISSGSPQVEGQWVDAKGMFLGGVHAGPVYRLLGKKDLGTNTFPKLGTALTDGEIAFRQHSGGHSTGPNWSTWIAWACRYWGTCSYE